MEQLEMLEKTNDRKCAGCKEVKHEEFFNRQRAAKTGTQGYCKSCQKDRKRQHYLKNKEDYATKQRNRQKNSIKAKAANAANYAIRTGLLTRQPCEKCGAAEVEAHHEDYAKPLDVRWLCRTHHRQHHALEGEALNACTVRHWTPPKKELKL